MTQANEQNVIILGMKMMSEQIKMMLVVERELTSDMKNDVAELSSRVNRIEEKLGG